MARPDFTTLKDHLRSGEKAINGWCAIPSAFTAELLAARGFDTVTIDLQHGLIDYGDALSMLQAIGRSGAPALCRVPWNEPGIIMKCLDAGFAGVICPMINSAEEAERLAAACRYPPLGSRSYGPTRASQVYGAGYAATANERVMVLAMIETRAALESLEDILSVPGVDGVYVGPSDLGLSLGHEPTLDPSEPEVLDAIAHIRQMAKGAGKIAGIHCGSPAMIRTVLSAGFDLASLLTDARILSQAVSALLSEARAERPESAVAKY